MTREGVEAACCGADANPHGEVHYGCPVCPDRTLARCGARTRGLAVDPLEPVTCLVCEDIVDTPCAGCGL